MCEYLAQLVIEVAREKNDRKTPLLQSVCFQIDNKIPRLFLLFYWVRIDYLFPKNYITSEGAFSQNVLYYQQLSIVRSNATLTIVLSNYQ